MDLTNESYVIWIGTKRFTERYYRDERGWLKVSARGRTFRMTAEQVLNHVLPALARSPDTSEALQRTLLSALLDPAAYNRIAGAQEPAAKGIMQFLRGLIWRRAVDVPRFRAGEVRSETGWLQGNSSGCSAPMVRGV